MCPRLPPNCHYHHRSRSRSRTSDWKCVRGYETEYYLERSKGGNVQKSLSPPLALKVLPLYCNKFWQTVTDTVIVMYSPVLVAAAATMLPRRPRIGRMPEYPANPSDRV